MDLKIILTSTVIATVISTVTVRKELNLKYITEERQKWREEIRKIAENISTASRREIRTHLAKLKVRINAYGKIDKKSYYKDAHIWSLIRDLEEMADKRARKRQFVAKKDDLIYFLSLMLKYDWERQKREVRGNRIQTVNFVLTSILLAVMVIWIIDSGFPIKALSVGNIAVTLLIVMPNFVEPLQSIFEKLYLKKKKSDFTIAFSVFCLLAFGGVSFFMWSIKDLMPQKIIFVSIVYFFVIVLWILNIIFLIKDKSDYEKICDVEYSRLK